MGDLTVQVFKYYGTGIGNILYYLQKMFGELNFARIISIFCVTINLMNLLIRKVRSQF